MYAIVGNYCAVHVYTCTHTHTHIMHVQTIIGTCVYLHVYIKLNMCVFHSALRYCIYYVCHNSLLISLKSGKNMCQPDTGKFHSSYIGMNVCGTAYENGCVVNGMCATAAD